MSSRSQWESVSKKYIWMVHEEWELNLTSDLYIHLFTHVGTSCMNIHMRAHRHTHIYIYMEIASFSYQLYYEIKMILRHKDPKQNGTMCDWRNNKWLKKLLLPFLKKKPMMYWDNFLAKTQLFVKKKKKRTLIHSNMVLFCCFFLLYFKKPNFLCSLYWTQTHYNSNSLYGWVWPWTPDPLLLHPKY